MPFGMEHDLELLPTVRFASGFRARAEALATKLARSRATSENDGRSWSFGAGDDFAGLRAYRPGDDPRAIDWTASARGDAPLVRMLRRARGGSEWIAIDSSLSMAIGPPAKLQFAAEIAAVLALLAWKSGALVTLVAPPTRARFVLTRSRAIGALFEWLETLVAHDALERGMSSLPRCDRATWIGDFAGSRAEDVARAAPRGVPFRALQILAPHEIAPHIDDSTRVIDPESGEGIDAGPEVLAEHAHALEARRRTLAHEFARRGGRFARASSAEPLENVCVRFVRP